MSYTCVCTHTLNYAHICLVNKILCQVTFVSIFIFYVIFYVLQWLFGSIVSADYHVPGYTKDMVRHEGYKAWIILSNQFIYLQLPYIFFPLKLTCLEETTVICLYFLFLCPFPVTLWKKGLFLYKRHTFTHSLAYSGTLPQGAKTSKYQNTKII